MWRYVRYFGTLLILYGMTAVVFVVLAQPRPPVNPYTPVANQIVKPRPLAPRLAVQGIPVRIAVPSLGIDLPVRTERYDEASGTWPVDNSGAFYADTSVPVNDNNGVTLIYAHAQSGLFDVLPSINADAEALVTTDNGHIFHYRFASMQAVDPGDVSVFRVSGPPQLVLQTCTGDWSQYRALFNFNLQSIEEGS